MTIVEALKRGRKAHRPGSPNYIDLTQKDVVVLEIEVADLLADDWEPILDRKEEIAERWTHWWWGTPLDAPEPETVKEAILGALREYEAGSVEAHIKAHEALSPASSIESQVARDQRKERDREFAEWMERKEKRP